MEGVNANAYRIGNFTSSNIYKLLTKNKKGDGFGAPALEYIAEKNMERILGLSLNGEVTSRETSWGTLCERFAFNLLGIEYTLSSSVTQLHPTIPFWAGTKDNEKFDEGKTVADIKCPFTRKSFCNLVDGVMTKEFSEDKILYVRGEHKSGEQYYWQLVSNAILTGSKYAELIVFMPYLSQLTEIRELANSAFGEDMNKFSWLNYATDSELPYLKDGGHYNNVNVIRFEVPESDKELLTQTVLEAGKLLIP